MSIPAVASGQQRYILVVDRDVNERFTLSMLLQRFGYTVASTSDPREAVEFLCVAPAEAVFAEAGSSGLEILERLRTDARFSDVPIVMVADGKDADLEARLRSGAIGGLLRKPLDPAEVFQIVQKVMENGRRSNIRIPTALEAELKDGQTAACGYVTVLSQFGMFFRTLHPREAGTRVPVELSLWDRTLHMEAEVLYVVAFDEGPFCEPGMGLKFSRIQPEDSALLKMFIYEQLGVSAVPPHAGPAPAAGQA